VRALGATPANLSFSFMDQIRAGKLRGAEFDIAQYEHNGFTKEAGNVTANVVLWPKVFVLALSSKRFDTLSPQQQTWVRDAARQAVTTSVQTPYDEATPARTLCGRGVRFAQATPAQVQALHARLRPVLNRLAEDPINGQLLRDIQTTAGQHSGPEVPNLPAGCTKGATDGGVGAVPASVSALPDGVYRSQITLKEITEPADAWAAGTWTLRIRQGTYELRCHPAANPGDDCGGTISDHPVEAGDLRGTGKTVYFVPNPERVSRLTGCKLPVSETLPGHCGPPFEAFRMTWAVASTTLSFDDFVGAVDEAQYLIKPWRKIA
jgi:hypothetical protein